MAEIPENSKEKGKEQPSKPVKFESRESNDVGELEKELSGHLSAISNYIKSLVAGKKEEKNPDRGKKDDGSERLKHDEVMEIIGKVRPVIKNLNDKFSEKEREILVKNWKNKDTNWHVFYTLSDEGDARPGGKQYDFGYGFESSEIEDSGEKKRVYSFLDYIGGPGDEGE